MIDEPRVLSPTLVGRGERSYGKVLRVVGIEGGRVVISAYGEERPRLRADWRERLVYLIDAQFGFTHVLRTMSLAWVKNGRRRGADPQDNGP